MSTLDLFQRLAVALAIGLLVGIERGWRERDRKAGSRTAGIRTYALIGLLGGVGAALLPAAGAWPLALIGAAFAAIFAAFEWRENSADKSFSVTGTVAGMVVYALGAYAVLGDIAVAGAGGIAAVCLLAARQGLHEFLRKLTWPELRSAVLLLAMTFLLLPVLPDRTIDPWNAINPHEIWLLTVLIAVVSSIGYIGVRLGGEARGLLYANAAGALVSSTTVTWLNALRARKNAADSRGHLALGVCIAWIVSLARMSALAAIVEAKLLPFIIPPVTAAALVIVAGGLYFRKVSSREQANETAKLQNPFELGAVLGFGALLTVIMVVVKLLNDRVGAMALIPFSALTGLADVDPITLSVAKIANVSISGEEAALAILVAAASNLAAKMTLAIVIGGARFGGWLCAIGMAAIAAGAAGTVFMRLWV